MSEAIDTVEDAVFDALSSSTALTAEVSVSMGHPGADAPREYVFTDQGHDESQRAGAGAVCDHEVKLQVIVVAGVRGGNYADAKARRRELVALVRAALAPVTDQAGAFMRPDGVTRTAYTSYLAADGDWRAQAGLVISGLVRD
jgi:hypothetical protein